MNQFLQPKEIRTALRCLAFRPESLPESECEIGYSTEEVRHHKLKDKCGHARASFLIGAQTRSPNHLIVMRHARFCVTSDIRGSLRTHTPRRLPRVYVNANWGASPRLSRIATWRI